MNWLKKIFFHEFPEPPTPGENLPTIDDWVKFAQTRPKMPPPEIQLELARKARIHNQQEFFKMHRLIQATRRPERLLRYFTVMSKRELARQRLHLQQSEDRLLQLEQALSLLEESLPQ